MAYHYILLELKAVKKDQEHFLLCFSRNEQHILDFWVTFFKSTMIWCVSNGLCTSQVNIKRMLLSLVWFKHSLLKIIRPNIDCHLNEHVSFLVCPCNRSCPYLSLPQPVLITYYLFDKSVALEAYWSTVMLIDAWFEAITSAFPNQMRNPTQLLLLK